jgi:hypothetical protein
LQIGLLDWEATFTAIWAATMAATTQTGTTLALIIFGISSFGIG